MPLRAFCYGLPENPAGGKRPIRIKGRQAQSARGLPCPPEIMGGMKMKERIVCFVLLISMIFTVSAYSAVAIGEVSDSATHENDAGTVSGEGVAESGGVSGNSEGDGEHADNGIDAEAEDEVDIIRPASLFGDYAMVPMLAGFVIIFYLLVVRPESKRKKKLAEMQNAVSAGDEIVTIEGIMGKVVTVDGEKVTIETSDENVRIQIAKWSIGSSPTVVPVAKKKSKKAVFVIAGGSAAAVALVLLVVFLLVIPMNEYNQALGYFNNGQYIEALGALEELPLDYRDVNELLPYFTAYASFEREEYKPAAQQFGALSGFRFSDKMRDESNYLLALGLEDDGKLEEALQIFNLLPEYKDSATRAESIESQLSAESDE